MAESLLIYFSYICLNNFKLSKDKSMFGKKKHTLNSGVNACLVHI